MSGTDDSRDRSKVQAVERALDLLVALAAKGGEGANISDLSVCCGLRPSTCHRLLGTMVAKGFVTRVPGGTRYALGGVAKGLVGHPGAIGRAGDLGSLVRPFMMELSQRTQETVNVAVLRGADVEYVDQIEALIRPPVRMFARAGSTGPAYCTGSGKALMAGLDDAELDALLEGLTFAKFTSETIDDPRKLRLELQRIRVDGYSLDMGERDVGVRCVAAPVYGYLGKVVCAVSVAGPASRLSSFYLHHELIGLVRDTARRASDMLRGHAAPAAEASYRPAARA